METDDFRKEAHALVDWMADFLESIRDYPVKPKTEPGEIKTQLPGAAPEHPEDFQQIFADFEKIILPGMTHWQHPSFHGYFPANSSPVSVLGEMLTATLGAQCMSWATSPAATELEEQLMVWLRQMIGLPENFVGVIQDTASSATLISILTAREQNSNHNANHQGLSHTHRRAVYSSTETHSSIEKAVRISGIGSDHLRKVQVDKNLAMIPEALEIAIKQDMDIGIAPLCVIATIGTTGSTAVDPIRAIGEICKKYGVWLHIDAAFSGNALILPEMRWMSDGVELADTFVFNPHKWMFTNFDCSAYFVKDKEALVRTFEISPEYLKTAEADRVNNYRDWGIALGRRFRALKLWFVIRSYGLEGLRQTISRHIEFAADIEQRIRQSELFELVAPRTTALVCFRYHPTGKDDPATLDQLNRELLQSINEDGTVFLTHAVLGGKYSLRMVTAQTNVTQADIDKVWNHILSCAKKMRVA